MAIATGQGWADIQPCIGSFAADAAALGAELVVADGSGASPPASEELPPGARWLREPGASVFQLLHLALRSATGDVVAVTEDHCRPRPGWLFEVRDAHLRHPEAAAIGGAIQNGSTATLRDWASYFITQGPHMAPLGDRSKIFISNESNVSYKRWALADLPDWGGLGTYLLGHHRRLLAGGAELRVDDRIVVDHFQSIPGGPTSWIHFHNGRSIAGFRRRAMIRGDWARLAVTFVLPWYRAVRAARGVLAKGRERRTMVASLPWMVWLEHCHAAGTLAGYALGPGDSPNQLH